MVFSVRMLPLQSQSLSKTNWRRRDDGKDGGARGSGGGRVPAPALRCSQRHQAGEHRVHKRVEKFGQACRFRSGDLLGQGRDDSDDNDDDDVSGDSSGTEDVSEARDSDEDDRDSQADEGDGEEQQVAADAGSVDGSDADDVDDANEDDGSKVHKTLLHIRAS